MEPYVWLFLIVPTVILIIVWVVAVVFAARVVINNGGRPEKFLLVGVSLMLVSSIFFNPVMPGMGMVIYGEFIYHFISGAGIIFLFCAFWHKLKSEKTLEIKKGKQ